MRRTDTLTSLFFATFFCCYLTAFSQANDDSLIIANSERLSVKLNKGLFGLSKPAFGNYATLNVSKLDSAVIKKKTKDSSYIGAEISSEGTDFDQSKFMTIEKTKFYKLSLGTASGAAEAVFAIASVSHEKRQTFLGKMMSKNDEDKDEILDENRDVPGIIREGIDSIVWKFFIDDFVSGSGQSQGPFSNPASIAGGFLKNEHDSLYMQTYSSFEADLVLINQQGEHLAALAFKQKHPTIWIRKNIDLSYQQAIATLFAVILSIKDY
ncbi:hypothetical protein FRZ67_13385 [Panacibacter ginsenosidivorans]|uniref:Uncharacterized protein n=1 Tax=Panacibacter ginsenosidivorans TaxID=1813871 RepID=A0A5B8VBE6_9BACT|nr:hypothetical protein [Panacibacter ginsenosidivorans]QEC68241.1 hypothetical protein FRZ67_13385 [Panacibacter ginsenosidivorans]